jgi:hypothetical protein
MSSIFKGRMYVYVMQDIKWLFVTSLTIFFFLCIEAFSAVMTCTAVFVFIHFGHSHLGISLHDENIGMTFDTAITPYPVILSAKYNLSGTATIINDLLARGNGIRTRAYKEKREEHDHDR